MLQNPDELHYMTTCLQRDNVKFKVVVNCARLVLVCVVMQKRKCLECPAAFGDLTIQRIFFFFPQFVDPVFFHTEYHFYHVMDDNWYSGHREAIGVLYYNASVTFSGFRPRV